MSTLLQTLVEGVAQEGLFARVNLLACQPISTLSKFNSSPPIKQLKKLFSDAELDPRIGFNQVRTLQGSEVFTSRGLVIFQSLSHCLLRSNHVPLHNKPSCGFCWGCIITSMKSKSCTLSKRDKKVCFFAGFPVPALLFSVLSLKTLNDVLDILPQRRW